VIGIMILVIACGGQQTAVATPPSVSKETGGVKHSVPLEDIVFDTFGKVSSRFVPLPEISEELRLELKDAITPVLEPVYGGPGALPWLRDDSLVIGYEGGGETFAYPINILNYHEIVNDNIGGEPVLITYCPLCFSGVVFNRIVDGDSLTFGNISALYQSDLVMYDHQTGSFWFQVAGEAVVGPLTGSRLTPLPSATMPWGDWLRLHPETKLLKGTGQSENAFAAGTYANGFGTGYQDRINNEKFVFPVDRDLLDDRLSAGEIVLTVEVAGGQTDYALGDIGDEAVNDEIGGEPVAVFTRSGGLSVGAFSRRAGNCILTFDHDGAGVFVDREMGTLWDFSGRAKEGPLAGSGLERLSIRRSLWFAVAISFPGIKIYSP